VAQPRRRTRTDRHRPRHDCDPYNAQIRAIQSAAASAGLPRLHVGTVDKFQGREARIVIYSMAISSAEDAPRAMEFLYDLHRLNVAASGARALATIVASPDLDRVACETPRQMHLANALCRAWNRLECADTPRRAGPADYRWRASSPRRCRRGESRMASWRALGQSAPMRGPLATMVDDLLERQRLVSAVLVGAHSFHARRYRSALRFHPGWACRGGPD
jgi:AAA domain